MPMSCQSEIQGDYLHISATGSLSSVIEMLSYIEKIQEELSRAGLSRMLVNETRCHMHMTLAELEDVVRELHEPKWFVLSKPKVAIVCSAINYPLQRHLFDAVRKVGVFLEEEEARQWLAQG